MTEKEKITTSIVPTRNAWFLSVYPNLSVCSCDNTESNVYVRVNLFSACPDSDLEVIICNFLFASVNLVSFLYHGNDHIRPMGCR